MCFIKISYACTLCYRCTLFCTCLFDKFWYVTVWDLLTFLVCSVPASATPRHNCCWFSSLISYGLHLGSLSKEGKTLLSCLNLWLYLKIPLVILNNDFAKWLSQINQMTVAGYSFMKCAIIVTCRLIRMKSQSINQSCIHISKAQSEDVTWRTAVPHTLKDQIE